jgi:hypothetical protein
MASCLISDLDSNSASSMSAPLPEEKVERPIEVVGDTCLTFGSDLPHATHQAATNRPESRMGPEESAMGLERSWWMSGPLGRVGVDFQSGVCDTGGHGSSDGPG